MSGETQIRDLQRSVAQWHRQEFPKSDLPQQALVLTEEVGEVCRAIVKKAQGIRGMAEHWDANLRTEVADVLIALCAVAEHAGIDLADALTDRWPDVRRRQFATDNPGQFGQLCECGHNRGAHTTPSMFPSRCKYCKDECPRFTVDRDRLDGWEASRG